MNKVVIMYTPAKLFEGNLSGGVKRFLELYKGLIANEIDVILFSSDEHNRLHSLGMENRSVRYVNPNNKTWIPLTVKSFIWNYRLINEIKKMKYDSLIVFDVPTAIHFCLLRATHVDLFIRQDLISYKTISISEKTKNKIFKKIYLKLVHFSEHICIRGARKIIVQCEYDKRELYKRHYNLKELLDKKMIVQINNVNPSWIVEKSNISVRKNRSIKFKICFVGDFNNERKGHRILIKAVMNLIDQGKKIEAILIGGGKKLDFYKEKSSNYPEIKFVGKLENPIKIMKECNLMVVPSLADSCPNTVMEALYNEVPVIGANSGGIPEILNNLNAVFDTDSLSLQQKIEYYMNGDNLMNLREHQQKRKQELTFDWSRVIIKYLKLNH